MPKQLITLIACLLISTCPLWAQTAKKSNKQQQRTQQEQPLPDKDNTIKQPQHDAMPILPAEQQEKEKIFTVVEQMPQFPGGEAELMKYLAANLSFSDQAIEEATSYRTVVRFVVQQDGSIGDITVVKSIGSIADAEIIRCIRSMPRWNPGTVNDIPVKTHFSLPINIRFSKE